LTEEYFFKNTKLWCDFLVNDLGCNDLKLQILHKKEDGDVIASKRISYFELLEKNFDEPCGVWNCSMIEFFEKANNFSGVDIMVALDFDDGTEEEYLQLIKKLKNDRLKFFAYSTKEGRCRHIHLFIREWRYMNYNQKIDYKEKIIDHYGCDKLKASHIHNLPICYPTPEGKEPIHWKTQKRIYLIDKNV